MSECRCTVGYRTRARTHLAVLLVALSGEIWTEEQVGDGQQQRLSQRPGVVLIVVFVQTLHRKKRDELEVARQQCKEVTAHGQEIVPHKLPRKTTTGCLYTVRVRVKQTSFNGLIFEL